MKHTDRFKIRIVYTDGDEMNVTNDRANTTALQLLVETVELFTTLDYVRIYDNVTGERATWMR